MFLGGKANNLKLLKDKGYNVPLFFVLDSTYFEDFTKYNSIYSDINDIIFNITKDNIFESSTKIEKLILESFISKEVKENILCKFKDLKFNKVSVRSSANCEDSKKYSFAGQFDSFLDINQDNLFINIKKVWVSLYSSRVLNYCLFNNINIHNLKINVIIQEMIYGDQAGVIFSKNPINNSSNEIIIEYTNNLADKLVSGEITPNSVIISKDNYNIILEDRNNSKIISFKDNELRFIVDIIKKVEFEFGYPVDVEFVFNNNKFYFLQLRPITK